MKKLLALTVIAGTALTACSGEEASTAVFAGVTNDTHTGKDGRNTLFTTNTAANEFTVSSEGNVYEGTAAPAYYDVNGGFVIFAGTKDGIVTDIYVDILTNKTETYELVDGKHMYTRETYDVVYTVSQAEGILDVAIKTDATNTVLDADHTYGNAKFALGAKELAAKFIGLSVANAKLCKVDAAAAVITEGITCGTAEIANDSTTETIATGATSAWVSTNTTGITRALRNALINA